MYSALKDEIKYLRDDMMTVKGDVKSLLLIVGGADWGRERPGGPAERSRPPGVGATTAERVPPSSTGKSADGGDDDDDDKTGGEMEKSTKLTPSSMGGMLHRNSSSMSDPALLTSSLWSLGPQGSRADNSDVGGVGAATEFSAMQQDVEDIAAIDATVARDYQTKKKNRPKKKKNMIRRRRGQKQQDVSKASDKNENGGSAAAAGSGRMTIVVCALMGMFAFFTCAQGTMGRKDWNRWRGPHSRRGRAVRMVPATVDNEDAHPPPKDYTLGENNKKKSSGDAFLRELQADSPESTNPMIPTTGDLASDEVLIPTPLPTYLYTSYPSHSPAFVCNDDPENCGCPNLRQADYRGSINTTNTGKACVRWDDENLNNFLMRASAINVSQFPDAGLKDNFCRNPFFNFGRAWCFTGAIGGEYGYWVAEECDVPACDSPHTSGLFIPMSSSRPMLSTPPSLAPTLAPRPTKMPLSFRSLSPTLSSSPTNTCHAADNSICGCEIVYKSDYRGTISTTEDGTECERWDAEWILFSDQTKEEKGLYGNYCRDPFDLDDSNGPACYTSADNFNDDGLPKLSLCVIPT
ncbi:hypothetical protein ACHAW5_006287, partial [Stephanodiscus triporus]